MRLLTDREILQKIENSEIVAAGFNELDKLSWTTRTSAIQPCSLDLHIGQIYLPKQPRKARQSHCLEPGQTIVIRTREVLDLPNTIAAIGFPPSSMSGKGILTTNPGHIDPGYRGVFHITLINMGKKSFPLQKGDVIVTLLLFELPSDQPVHRGFSQRMNPACEETDCPCNMREECAAEFVNGDSVTDDMLNCLAPDFMDFKSRSKRLVRSEMILRGWLKELLAVAGSLIVALGVGFWGYTGIRGRIADVNETNLRLQEDLRMLSERVDGVEYFDKIKLRDKIARIEEQLSQNDFQQQSRTDIQDDRL